MSVEWGEPGSRLRTKNRWEMLRPLCAISGHCWWRRTGTGLAAVGKLSAKFDLRTRARGLTYTHAPLCRLAVASEAQAGSSENTALGFMAAPVPANVC
jgi:hypothetical protein